MRGIGGDVKEKDGYEYIDGGLFIMCYDNVTIPSHPPAYIQEIIKEGEDLCAKMLTESFNGFGKSIEFNTHELNSLNVSLGLNESIVETEFKCENAVDNFLRNF